MSGPFGSSQWMYASGFYGHEINQSVRFASGDGGFATKTFSSAGNREKWTLSFWIKRARLSNDIVFYALDGSQNTNIAFNSLEGLYMDVGGVGRVFRTNMTFNDQSAWYNIVIAHNTTDYSTVSAGQVKVYVNGTEQSFAETANMSQGGDYAIGNAVQHTIGRDENADNNYAGFYLAEMHMVNGSQLTASSFGETKAGIWIPKKYTGSHGTNGFHFTFADTSSNDALFNDDSANSNNFSTTGIVAGHDFMKDSPTNNFATLKTHGVPTSATLTQGNLEFTSGTGDSARNLDRQCISTILIPTSGKWYCEVLPLATTSTFIGITAHQEGQIDHAANNTRYAYFYPTGDGGSNGQIYIRTGASESIQNYGATSGTGDIIGVFVDMDQSTPRLYFSKNGQWASGSSFNQSNPTDYVELGDSFFTTDSDSGQGAFGAARAGGSTSIGPVFNFGQDGGAFRGQQGAGSETDSNGNGLFKYAVPSGGLALCTANLPSPGIDPEDGESPADYFNTVLYTGTGSSASVTGVGFAPDWVWIKERSSTSGHSIHDTVRGTNKRLDSSSTSTDSASGVTAFGADGFTQDGGGATGESSETYVSWNWLAGGSASSNSDGTITSSVSASQEAGFSIVTYTGTGSNATVGHGLGKVPEWIVLKKRTNDTQAWQVYHSRNTSAPETEKLTFNTTAATVDDNTTWNDTAPTSTVFSIGTGSGTNENTDTYVAYCFANIEGYSKFGDYTGNGNADGPVIILGFRPAWLMVKRTDTTNNWVILDSERDPHNVANASLLADSGNAETDYGVDFDFLANGFKVRTAGNPENADGGTYVYMAFAEQPFKFANAR